jgi:hypothetical protein
MDVCLFSVIRGLLYRFICLLLLWIITGHICAETKTQDIPEVQRFLNTLDHYWSFIWAGSWENEGNLVNRADLRFHIPWQDLTLRVQLIDQRPGAFASQSWEDFTAGTTAFSGGLYHEKTGSRVLYGILNESGFSTRLSNLWTRSIPFVEYHKPSRSDLRTTPSSTKEPETYLYLSSQQLGMFKGFGSIRLDEYLNPAFASGVDVQFSKKTNLRIEGFYTGKKLVPRNATAWFSKYPPLPERDFHIYALGLVYTSSFLSIATDWAYSDTFAYGRDMYGNLGLQIGKRPWLLSLVADGAGSRYVGANGIATGPGFRLGAKLEQYGTKNRLFRLSTSFRSNGFGEAFERSSSLIYYRFSTNFWSFPVKPSRVSLRLARNASNKEKIEDKIEGLIGINWGSLRSVFSGTVTGLSSTEENPLPFPFPEESLAFNSATISGELFYNLSIFQFRTKWGYTIRHEKDSIWDTAFQVTVRGKPGRFSLKIMSPEFPTLWTCTLTWHLEKK